MSELTTIINQAKYGINTAADLSQLDQIRVNILGKKGQLTELLKSLGKLPPELRREQGQVINAAKDEILVLLEAKKNELEKQQLQIISFIVGLVLLALLLITFYNRYRVTQKQKAIIEEQKIIVDKKNKDIIASINYAQSIQQTMFIPEAEIQESLPGSFIYYKPKDIVSGDFYWFSRKDNMCILAVADCTGHGVPGAFLTMLGNSLLNEIVNEKEIMEPGRILDQLQQGIVKTFQGKNTSDAGSDGMDISLCTLDMNTGTLAYAGAKNHLYIVQDKNVSIVKADSWSIGAHTTGFNYSTKRIQLSPGASIYLFSDGILDQFGGPDKKKKFGRQQFSDLILKLQDVAPSVKKQMFWDALLNWAGSVKQIDDQLVMGFQLMS